jgi:hypothetical protein
MVSCADAASRAENLDKREPILARAVEDPDGNCPKPPSPRFPVWKPRHLDGGVFLFGDRRTTPKIGCNDPCPCESDKKLKQCCGRTTNHATLGRKNICPAALVLASQANEREHHRGRWSRALIAIGGIRR